MPQCPSFEALTHKPSDHMGGGSSFYYLDTTTCWSAYKAPGNKSSRRIETQSKAHDDTGTQITKTFDANSNYIESLSKSQDINLRFGDLKCLGGSYEMTDNVIVNDYPQPPADGELKVPWIHDHSLGEIHHRYEYELHTA
ncbi:hypothetical protein N7452_003773 [Penicillium brevicompactum]|uniref:Uncharacterized protein n=1 Tax=Penicillium brevicompactum TaxID=5074 RepID=A0A9W9QUI0_PENBR|nr:hypothetical protein N7452_003773 [Penicillium brevicompactum]